MKETELDKEEVRRKKGDSNENRAARLDGTL